MAEQIRWTPRVTVASVIERDHEFLMVEEQIKGTVQINQPAGHWEPNETLLQAASRETLEETGWSFEPRELVGIYHWVVPKEKTTFLRFTFCGELGEFNQNQNLDEGILGSRWMNLSTLEKQSAQHRSPLVLLSVKDYLAGKRLPLDCIQSI